ncbi:Com family DNA-binding transcriptional regulator [Pseudomonas synxantha]|uniref:Com family DNA-binding transcriptional regulator n=1 Tax=Pseudomonas synxantha TaxID=47883 RepID=A0ABS0UFX8_9PSED|nr:Com family DNA-binding transcriptional regulator [Pseudomonas synxantha]MBI6564501.1 Com family DNA-binding transcriptional regulator [Pseudomonas synxantha]MBI6583302.1 Com family DNA-binding transcriptional regulator [Pseudomonas synxantha]MBI6646825.1 Com family DNA-binding transcriptional regulator [Pseudomonas synxantha]
MLKEFRCGSCNKLLARAGRCNELQIKCPRCGTLNHVKATSLGQSPSSDVKRNSPQQTDQKGDQHVQ